MIHFLSRYTKNNKSQIHDEILNIQINISKCFSQNKTIILFPTKNSTTGTKKYKTQRLKKPLALMMKEELKPYHHSYKKIENNFIGVGIFLTLLWKRLLRLWWHLYRNITVSNFNEIIHSIGKLLNWPILIPRIWRIQDLVYFLNYLKWKVTHTVIPYSTVSFKKFFWYLRTYLLLIFDISWQLYS